MFYSTNMSPQEQTIRQLFDTLEQKQLLDLKPRSNLSSEFTHIVERVGNTGNVFSKLRQIFGDGTQLNNFIQNNSSFGLDTNDIMTIFSNYLTQYSLDYIEIVKRFFIENLKQGARIDGKTINLNMTLGTLVHSLANECNLNSIVPLFPFAFRNVLGHSNYWWDNNNFCYDENGTIQRLTFSQFMDIMTIFDNTYTLIFREYMGRLH